MKLLVFGEIANDGLDEKEMSKNYKYYYLKFNSKTNSYNTVYTNNRSNRLKTYYDNPHHAI